MVVVPADRMPSASTFREAIQRHARYSLAQPWETLTTRQVFECVCLTVRDIMVDRMLESERRYRQADAKHLYYLSIEYLPGRYLANNLINLGLYDLCRETLAQIGVDLAAVEASERDPALGNGGLGRLAACFLDSLATLGMPGHGYGINYEYGLFRQEIDGGNQKEKPDNWLAARSPWQIERPEETCLVPVHGRIEHGVDRSGNYNPMWLDWQLLVAIPYDVLVVGYGGRTVNRLRLFSARSSHDFDMQIFNDGDYLRAVEQKIASETISKVLYPSDAIASGQELRLIQEYFLVACSLRDIVRRYERDHATFDAFPTKVAIHLNDTHPALAVAELMRILVDERDLPWDTAWQITQATMGYTNHTLLPEALEKWPVSLLEHVVPRHLQIIYEINRRFLEHVASVSPSDSECLRRMSLIEEGPSKQVRMAHLAIVGSHSVNGVSALHSKLVQTTLAPGLLSALAGALQQQDERRHAAPLAGAGQSAVGAADHQDDRRWVDHRPRQAPRAGAMREGWRIPGRIHGHQAVQQGAAGPRDRGDDRRDRQPGFAVRRSGQADSRVQAAIAQRHAHRARVSVPDRRRHSTDRAQDLRLCGKGGAGLPGRQADHQDDLQRRIGHQQRSASGRADQGRVRSRLSGVAGRTDHPGRGLERADLDRRHRGVGHRKHEARHERRADDRHARWGEHRTPCRGGSGEYLHLRPHRR